MGKADLHIHTTYSDGMGTVPAVLESASRTDLNLIAITDHDEIRGALEARDLAPRYGLTVVPGTEVTTAEGHLLALFVEQRIPQGEPLIDTVLRVGDLGGICIAPHPMALWVPSLSDRSIYRALAHPVASKTLVGVEVYNAGLPYLPNNGRAAALGNITGLAKVANSDSHLLWTIGLSSTEFPGGSAQHLRQAIEQRLTRPLIRKRPMGFYLSFLKGVILREAGLAYWTSQPGDRIVLRRLGTVSS